MRNLGNLTLLCTLFITTVCMETHSMEPEGKYKCPNLTRDLILANQGVFPHPPHQKGDSIQIDGHTWEITAADSNEKNPDGSPKNFVSSATQPDITLTINGPFVSKKRVSNRIDCMLQYHMPGSTKIMAWVQLIREEIPSLKNQAMKKVGELAAKGAIERSEPEKLPQELRERTW